MIKIPVVESCPYTKVGTGVLKLSHSVIATLAGAVHDRDEWMAFLIGTRSEDGLTVTVTGLQVPKQYRGSTSCELVKKESLHPGIVGVVHSHHSMPAFFSPTDHTTLNPRFPVSLVIAQNKTTMTDEIRLLGFQYKAEGRAPLPCKSIGVISYTVLPDPLVDQWPVTVTVGYQTPAPGSVTGCPHTNRVHHPLSFYQEWHTTCGLQVKEPASAIFGAESTEFMKEVNEKTREWIPVGHVEGYTPETQSRIPIRDKRYQGVYRDLYKDDILWNKEMWGEEERLPGWSEYY